MKKSTLNFVFFLVIAVSLSGQSSEKWLEKDLPRVENFLKEEMKTRKIPGLVYGIFNENGLIVSGAYGLANVQYQIPVHRETVFELASLTKQFTAAAILILQQDGKLKVEDTLCKYLKACPEEWSAITIHQLLTHTAGLPGSWRQDGSSNLLAEYSGIFGMDPLRVALEGRVQPKQYEFDLVKTDALENPPGTAFDYSNVGYFLLGMVIDELSGSYREFLKDRIFIPLGMNSTYFEEKEKIRREEAGAYTLRNGELIHNPDLYQLEIPAAGGDLFSNLIDLQKWDAALNTEKILTKESKQLLWQGHIASDDKYNYGYGWLVLEDVPQPVVWHNGSSGVEYLKVVGRKISVVVLTNLGQGNYDRIRTRGLTEGIAKILELYPQ